jgi:uncharacterized protein YdeI (YjbR/CyaY-like superfamily)
MTIFGLEAIEKAKSNGSYFLSDSIENLEIPDELEVEFLADTKLRDVFNGLSSSRKKRILYEIITLKTPLARKRRASAIAKNLADSLPGRLPN